MADSTKKPNKLINETSPYLLQHAYNPVNWFPWSDEAFIEAEMREKPVFLSIGYSTCHWCHVMEQESFEDEEVAAYLNAHYVAVKVDKEERPDIDSVYMGVCQALTGGGGWPLTILMTPEKIPFYAGTYFPKRSRYGHLGLLELLDAVRDKWLGQRERLYETGSRITEVLSQAAAAPQGAGTPDTAAVERAARQLSSLFDRQYGGFGAPPKFPTPHNLMFLLRVHALDGDKHALQMVETTLRQMSRGGIFDQIGFGFSRYSTDEKWLAPHFEKMLYDNALLVIALTECFQVTKNPFYESVARRTLLYVAREMTSPEGGFYCAQDADIGGEEGKYYTFTPGEILEVLGEKEGVAFCKRYDITERGNFEGKSIPNLIGTPDFFPLEAETEIQLARLREYRSARFSLHRDDKLLTAWNALMIAALAKASRVFGDDSYLSAALTGMDFVKSRLMKPDGSLSISYRDGKTRGEGLLDDYAFLCWACLELYEATFALPHLELALRLAGEIPARFADEAGGFFLSPAEGEKLPLRPKEQYDGAMPSGNSAAAYCFARLALLTGEERWRREADRQLAFYADSFTRQPQAHTFALMALMLFARPSKEVVCVAGKNADTRELVRGLAAEFRPQVTAICKTEENAEQLAKLVPFSKDYPFCDTAGFTFYLCQERSCSPPLRGLGALLAKL